MKIIIEKIEPKCVGLYQDGFLYDSYISGISIQASININNITIEGNFKFDSSIFNEKSSIEDYKNAIKKLFKGE